MTPIQVAAAHRAIDEREIAKHGPLVAVLKAPSQDAMVRRAAIALRQVEPHELVPVLGMWTLLNGGAS